ncbi:NlpC/P60 family protein [Labrenzia sp. DG1229]|uniref:NlpC/P60 family protein n=1 Tax=Labrenzia sp. DG1229 TaxID=681847 RepID=UPI00048D17B7|nr:NlpC/P60 family protein [Labrenzia sp. DG1229]
MSWSNSYIGIPFEAFGRAQTGCDCYGLAVLIYARELGMQLTSYVGDYVSCDERRELDGLFSSAIEVGPWRKVEGKALAFDIALFRRGVTAAHCGVVISDGVMLHVQGEDQVKVESYRTGPWKLRLLGHYRHVERLRKSNG